METTPTRPHRSSKERLKQLVIEYGTLGIITYLVICLLWFGGSWLAIHLGWKPESAAGTAGTLAATYVAYKLMMPARIAITVVLTPIIARVAERLKLRRPRTPAA